MRLSITRTSLEMQILGLHPRPTGWETLGMGLSEEVAETQALPSRTWSSGRGSCTARGCIGCGQERSELL